jgi:branched-chain amino acid transport system substrate-binding protein
MAIAAGVGLGIAAPGSAVSAGAPIKIGAITSLTGPAAFTDWSDGAAALFKRINASGGINGHPVQWTDYDDGGNPTQASDLARKLVGQGIVAFVASLSLDDCAVNRQYYQQVGIVSIDIGSDFTCFDTPNMDPVNSGPLIDPELQMIYAAKVLHKTKICVMAYAVPGEAEDVTTAIKGFEQVTGLKPTLTITGFSLTGDQTPAVLKFRNAGCQAVSVSADLNHGVPFVKDVAAQGISEKKMQVIFGLATYSPAFIKAVGAAGNGVLMGLEFGAFDTPGDQQMLADFKNDGLPDSADTVTGWTAAYAFAHVVAGIKGPITRASVTHAFKTLTPFNVPTMGTPFTFGSASAHTPNTASFWVKLVNGKFVDQSKSFFVLPANGVR